MTGDEDLDDRALRLKDQGVYWCPQWCQRPDDEDEQHVSQWYEHETEDGHIFRARALGAWCDDGVDSVDVEIAPYSGQPVIATGDDDEPIIRFSLTEHDCDKIENVLMDARGDLGYLGRMSESYPGAAQDEEGDDEEDEDYDEEEEDDEE